MYGKPQVDKLEDIVTGAIWYDVYAEDEERKGCYFFLSTFNHEQTANEFANKWAFEHTFRKTQVVECHTKRKLKDWFEYKCEECCGECKESEAADDQG